ncbi:hypothetical protein AYI69_g8320 [Smittium culicis]|uniref:DUF3074 domain-containing protein n=1 Tax=Smittium culicis TaxID=133412 RepID=A0A1R1XKI3_9FUNG|nr:hypothetical protein AYI69_g8320 [Smittium culicis]
MSMVLSPIKLSVIPQDDKNAFMEFISNYENKCNDLMYYSSKWPTIKSKNNILIRKRVRNPGDMKRWYCREVCSNEIKYEEIRKLLLGSESENFKSKTCKNLVSNNCVQSFIPGRVGVYHTLFSKRWGGGKRDFCSLEIKKEFNDNRSALVRKHYTPANSYANLSLLGENAKYRTGSSSASNSNPHSITPSPIITPTPTISTIATNELKAMGGDPNNSRNIALNSLLSKPSRVSISKAHPSDISPSPHSSNFITRKFQIISVPLNHPKCLKESGYTRSFIESFTEVRELSNGDIEWITVQNYVPGGWLVKSIADRAYFDELFGDCESILDELIQPK